MNGLCGEREGNIHYRERLLSVVDSGHGIRARTASAAYDAKFLVCALPPRQVLAGIIYCSVTKTFFQFERPFWNSVDFSLVTGTIYQHICHTAGSTPDGPAALVAFSTGEASQPPDGLKPAES